MFNETDQVTKLSDFIPYCCLENCDKINERKQEVLKDEGMNKYHFYCQCNCGKFWVKIKKTSETVLGYDDYNLYHSIIIISVIILVSRAKINNKRELGLGYYHYY